VIPHFSARQERDKQQSTCKPPLPLAVALPRRLPCVHICDVHALMKLVLQHWSAPLDSLLVCAGAHTHTHTQRAHHFNCAQGEEGREDQGDEVEKTAGLGPTAETLFKLTSVRLPVVVGSIKLGGFRGRPRSNHETQKINFGASIATSNYDGPDPANTDYLSVILII
jgi:hypothetical protein